MEGYLKQRSLELLEDEGQTLVEPYRFKQPNTDGYAIIIVDAKDTYHFFFKDESGILIYDGWDSGNLPIVEICDN